MFAFSCPRCGQLLFFENSACLGCGTELGVEPGALVLGPVPPRYRRCANEVAAGCNWLVAPDDPVDLCRSCRLTQVRPNDFEPEAMAAFRHAEEAKRQLLHQIWSLGLPVENRHEHPDDGLAFHLLWSTAGEVVTGHRQGVITLDLAESDPAYRELVRLQLGEPYRTVLGHLRHEIGHYFWMVLIERGGRLEEFRAQFGDERAPYDTALARHYGEGPPTAWSSRYVSAYATMHPWEDWAETFAHYLHIQAGTETATSFGLQVGDPSRRAARRSIGAPDAAEIGGGTGSMIEHWLTLTFGLNAVARALGQEALYPFVLPAAVIAKLDFVHRCIEAAVGVAPRPGRSTA